jgi:homoserine kinase type II
MGTKRLLTLSEAKILFPKKNLLKLVATTDGISDSTYIAHSQHHKYIVKFFETSSVKEVRSERELLKRLYCHGLNVPRWIKSVNGWHLFSYLEGESPQHITLWQVGEIARFLGKMHKITKGKSAAVDAYPLEKIEGYIENLQDSNTILARLFRELLDSVPKSDGIIHGDLFPDNVKFQDHEIGVFDFIGGGNGAFVLDVAVVVVNWLLFGSVRDKGRIIYFLRCYNQVAPFKISYPQLLPYLRTAILLFALLRTSNLGRPYREQLYKLHYVEKL